MIEFNADQISGAMRTLSHIPGAAPKAIAKALNRASETAKTEAARKVRESYYIKHGDILRTIKLKKATPSNLSSMVISTGRPIALAKFKITPARPSSKRKSPIIARVKKGEGGPIAHAFVARMKSGHVGVFNRVGKSSKPIDQRYGPSVPQMLGSSTVTGWVEQKSREKLTERLEHEINRVLGGVR